MQAKRGQVVDEASTRLPRELDEPVTHSGEALPEHVRREVHASQHAAGRPLDPPQRGLAEEPGTLEEPAVMPHESLKECPRVVGRAPDNLPAELSCVRGRTGRGREARGDSLPGQRQGSEQDPRSQTSTGRVPTNQPDGAPSRRAAAVGRLDRVRRGQGDQRRYRRTSRAERMDGRARSSASVGSGTAESRLRTDTARPPGR